ncbi:MAG: DNA replication/repair protein RecF [Bacteroidota bacterium]|jgi:DNA replication and repair protein RecF|nr:DNA replication/repair protein RecF [Cytophagales bacterium]MCE2958990.1 DNA replication and repair protein RecF [Flammeovirgaceae bacterium]MCZ8070030.1 DNA replication and repair protein RecF [Cytophagales bacterium]
MFLHQLYLFNFRNIDEARLSFADRIICLLGKNGSGKTTVLDAIHYLSFTKSAINPADAQNIRHGEQQFVIRGKFREQETTTEVTCAYTTGQKKIINEDGRDYAKFSDHVGKYPVVMIAPQDIELIWDGSELRRKFVDSVLSQLDKTYLENLIVYTYQLKQRNSLLKSFAEAGRVDQDLLASYDHRLVPAANYIFEARANFLKFFIPFFRDQYRYLVGDVGEEVSIEYQSDLREKDFAILLSANLQRDVLLQRTTTGIHRDDFDFRINGFELKRHGSQGQQKSFLIALKLAEFQAIAEKKKFKPILLLDDIFDKLDDERIHQLMRLVAQGQFGQLLITDARADRTLQIMETEKLNATIFRVENGKVTNG